MTEMTRKYVTRALLVPVGLAAIVGINSMITNPKQECVVQATLVDTALDTGWQSDNSQPGVVERRVTRGINSNVVEYRIDSNGDGIADVYKREACGHDAYAHYSCTTTETKMPVK